MKLISIYKMASNQCFAKDISPCSIYSAKLKDNSKVSDLNKECASHLKSIGFGGKHVKLPTLDELDLICDRLNIDRTEVDKDAVICSGHRYKCGIYYRPPLTCKFQKHTKNGKKQTVRLPTFDIIDHIVQYHESSWVLGQKICRVCENQCKTEMAQKCSQSTLSQPSSSERERFVSKETFNEIFETMSKTLEKEPAGSPLKWQCNDNLSNLHRSGIAKCSEKYKNFMDTASEFAKEAIAPGQSDSFDSIMKDEDKNELSVQNLIDAYSNVESTRDKMFILSLFPSSVSAPQLIEYTGCTRYQALAAIGVRKKLGAGVQIERKEGSGLSKLDIEKAEHFLDFLFSNAFLQSSPFGTNKLKLSTGESITIPTIVRLNIRNHLITEYVNHCKVLNYKHLSVKELYIILNYFEYNNVIIEKPQNGSTKMHFLEK